MTKDVTKQVRASGRRRSTANGVINGSIRGASQAQRSTPSDFEARWACMDELAQQLDAQWPAGVGAVEALSDVRRGG